MHVAAVDLKPDMAMLSVRAMIQEPNNEVSGVQKRSPMYSEPRQGQQNRLSITSVAPAGACFLLCCFFPWLAPRATFCRRYAAKKATLFGTSFQF